MAAIIFHEPIFSTQVESGDKLYFYEVGTTTDLTVYTDFALTTAASQPVVADSDGRFAPLYINFTGNDPKVVLTDSSDVEKWTVERYPIEDTSSLASDVAQNTSDITALDGRVTTNEADIDTLETESADYETRITTLEGATIDPTFAETQLFDNPTGTQSGTVTLSQDYTDFNALIFLTSRGTSARAITHVTVGVLDYLRAGGLAVELATFRPSKSNAYLLATPTSTTQFTISDSDEGVRLYRVYGVTY